MTALRAFRLLFVALLLFVTYMTLTPNPDDTEGEMSIARWIAERLFGDEALGDKVAHFLAYAALAVSAALARLTISGRRMPVVVALALWGVALEIIQGLGGVRVADSTDALANALGAFGGASAATLGRLARAARPA